MFGLGLGGGHIFNSWFMEFVPAPNQGYWMAVFSAFFTAGTIVQALLVLLIIPNYNWRWLLVGAIAPHFVALCFIWPMPESPRFLCAQGRVLDAQIVLAEGATINKKKLPEGTLVYDQINSTAGTDQPVRTPGPLERSDEAHGTDQPVRTPAQTPPVTDDDDNSIHSSEIIHASTEISNDEHDDEATNHDSNEILTDQHEIEMPTDEHDDEPKLNARLLQSSEIRSGVSLSKTSIFQILSPRWRRTTLLIWFLYFFNTFNYYGIVLLTSQSSTSSLLTSDTSKISRPLLDVVITSVAEIPGLMIAAIMLNKFGRKFSMEILFGAGFIVLFVMVFFQSKAVTMVFMFLARMFMSSSFVLVQIYSTQAYPTKLRTTGVGVAMALGNIGGTVWPLAASAILDSGHKTLPFMLFEAKILISGLCVWFLPVGTTEKKLVLPVQRDPPPD